MALEYYREEILKIFGITNTMIYSVQEPKKVVWETLEALVKEWWRDYQAWEKEDTLAKAYNEQRLTVKGAELATKGEDNKLGVVEWDKKGEAFSAEKQFFEMPKTDKKVANVNWEAVTPAKYYPVARGVQGVMQHLEPTSFVPKMVGQTRGPSKKTELGLHDLSVGLMCPGKKISDQQYKDVKDNKIYFIFMPLSHPGDQAVFQNINRLANTYKEDHAQFYDFVRQIRSQMTRVKLAAEHDLGTTLVCIGRTSANRPKFELRPASTTSASILDKVPEVGTQEFKNMAIKLGVSEAQLEKRRKIGRQDLEDQKQKAWRDFKIEEGKAIAEGIKVDAHGEYPDGDILAARRTATLNFQSLILKIYSYGEVVRAFRKHAGQFPKLAKFDPNKNLWKVGELVNGNQWKFKSPAETFPDQPT